MGRGGFLVVGAFLLLVLAVVMPAMAFSLTSVQSAMDFNGDNTLNMTDARSLIRAMTDRRMDPVQRLVYDVNGDTRVNIIDLARLIREIKAIGMQPGACNDDSGTLAEKCSLNKPYYCNSISVLMEDCTRCGCPEGQTCGRTGKCSGEASTGILNPAASMIFADFWGMDSSLNAGDVVTAKDSSDVPCGSYTVVAARNYIIHVFGDDSSTTTDEGAGTNSNDNVKIYVNGMFRKAVAWPGDKSSVRMEI